MKHFTLSRCAWLALTLAVLSGCSAHCNCPVCPVQTQQPQTTIIHEPQE